MFKRRIGPDPHAHGQETPGACGCPDIWELDDGNFAVIGLDQTEYLHPSLPLGASCGSDERIVVLPRGLLVNARAHIPNK